MKYRTKGDRQQRAYEYALERVAELQLSYASLERSYSYNRRLINANNLFSDSSLRMYCQNSERELQLIQKKIDNYNSEIEILRQRGCGE